MLRKTLLMTAGAALAAGLFFGRDAVSYVSTSFGWMRQTVKNSVPVDFEIERARKMIRDLDPEIRSNMHVIAKEEVEVARLKEQLNGVGRQVEKERKEIVRLQSDLKGGGSSFVYSGQAYTTRQVETDLARRFDRFKTKEATADKLRKILEAREAALAAANDKLKGMLAAKQQLEVEVENLRARVEMVRVAETTSHFNFDDSHLARTRAAIEEIGARIDVAEKLANAHVTLPDQIRVEDDEAKDISAEISKYFAERPAAEDLVKLD